jgi:hypothetical protein
VTNAAEQTAPKSSKRQTKQTKVDHLLAQGTMIEVDVDGRRALYLKMPTPELQDELNTELEKEIKKRFKASGFERVCATRRDHPFHSALLRERIDDLARDITVVDHKSGTWCRLYLAPEEAWKLLTDRHADWHEGMQAFRAIWAKAYEEYQEMRRSPLYWRGTSSYNTVFPPNGPELPDGPRPKPVYLSKRNPDLVIQLRDNFVDLYTRTRR